MQQGNLKTCPKCMGTGRYGHPFGRGFADFWCGLCDRVGWVNKEVFFSWMDVINRNRDELEESGKNPKPEGTTHLQKPAALKIALISAILAVNGEADAIAIDQFMYTLNEHGHCIVDCDEISDSG